MEQSEMGRGLYKVILDIEQLPEGLYLGTSPHLPGLVVQGEDAQDVLRLVSEVARDLISVIETNQPLPPEFETPTSVL